MHGPVKDAAAKKQKQVGTKSLLFFDDLCYFAPRQQSFQMVQRTGMNVKCEIVAKQSCVFEKFCEECQV